MWRLNAVVVWGFMGIGGIEESGMEAMTSTACGRPEEMNETVRGMAKGPGML